jgi:hypothetical protein
MTEAHEQKRSTYSYSYGFRLEALKEWRIAKESDPDFTIRSFCASKNIHANTFSNWLNQEKDYIYEWGVVYPEAFHKYEIEGNIFVQHVRKIMPETAEQWLTLNTINKTDKPA